MRSSSVETLNSGRPIPDLNYPNAAWVAAGTLPEVPNSTDSREDQAPHALQHLLPIPALE